MKRFKRILPRFVLTALVAVLALGVELTINTLHFASRQIDVKQAAAVDLDETALAQRLAKAIRVKTISPENRSDVDPKPSLEMHALLEGSFSQHARPPDESNYRRL